MIGRILNNRYKLISELGSGGMAWVYLAQDRREEVRVAVKILYPQLSQDVGFLQRFTQEAKLAMSLAQASPEKHVARILDYGSDRDIHYLVMEYVDGRDLRRVLKEEGPLEWKRAFDIARQVALALGHAHQYGIVHRDIKPENIMLLPDGTVRVLDFGVARARTSPTLTHSGFVGSPLYAAPEQAMGHKVDIRADLYSLGVVMYQLLSGELPFQSDTPWVMINHHIATPPPNLKDVCPHVPGSAAHLIRKAMSKRPEDRYQTPGEIVQAIDVVLSGLDLPLEPVGAGAEALTPLLEGLYRRAEQASEEKEWQEAVDLYSQILKIDPCYRDVTDRLAEAGRQARLAGLYTAATRSLDAEHWSEAVDELEEIVALEPNYRNASMLLVKTCQEYEIDRLYREGTKHLETRDWAAAITLLSKVQAEDPHYARSAEHLKTAQAEQAKIPQKRPEAATTSSKPSQPARPRRRRLLLAVAAILILALFAQAFSFYLDQQPPISASVSAASIDGTSTAALTIAQRDPRTALPTSPGTDSFSETRPALTISPTTPIPGQTEVSTTPGPVSTGESESTLSPVFPLASTRTTTPTLTPEALLQGQIVFPRFDPERATYDVYICLVDGSNCRRVATEASQPDLVPGGAQLLVHSWKADDKGLVLQTLSGQRIWQITDELEAARPSVDFQGKRIVYQSRQETDRLPRLFRTYDAEIRPIQREASAVVGHSPSWLPDGRILYSGCVGAACGIIVMQADGSYPQQIVPGSQDTNPEASPDGKRIAFMSARDGNWEIYAVNTDGSNLQRLTQNPANDGLPTWSPAPPGGGTGGEHIAFVSDRDGTWAIWAMRSDGSELQRLFEIGGSPDGRVSNAALHESHGWVEERISWESQSGASLP